MYVAIYGPPGAGKSTVIRAARDAGLPAFDLEDSGGSREDRVRTVAEVARHGGSALFGAADVPPEGFPAGTILVLLLPSEAALQANVELRGDRRGHKWTSTALRVRAEHEQMASVGMFHLVLRENLSPERTLREILERTGFPGGSP
ncbi:MAG TPA: hypothetical protein VGQ83_29635 [Polyangia bacterium]|jgi:hypothetical protein